MKTTQMKLYRISMMVLMGCVIALAFSCGKHNSLQPQTDAQQIANSLKGEVLTGAITTESDEEGVAFLLNGGKLLIALEKIPLQEILKPGNIEHAQIIYSDYGVIVRDTDTGKSWYYIQNDAASKQKFNSLPGAGENAVFSAVAGTIKLNLSQNS